MPWQSDVNEIARKIVQVRAGGNVERCHGIRHLGSDRNARPQWGAAMLMWFLWPEHFSRLAINVLTHDCAEFVTGDIPSPTMRYVPGMKAQIGALEDRINIAQGVPGESGLSAEDHLMVKICDWFDFYLWCREEDALGSLYAREGLVEITLYINSLALPPPADALWKAFHSSSFSVVPTQSGVMRKLMEK